MRPPLRAGIAALTIALVVALVLVISATQPADGGRTVASPIRHRSTVPPGPVPSSAGPKIPSVSEVGRFFVAIDTHQRALGWYAAVTATTQRRAEQAAAAQAARDAARLQAHVARHRPSPTYVPQRGAGRCGGSLPSCAIMMCESRGDIHAQNSHSSASGKWQVLSSTWGHYMGYPTAASAPESVQDQFAARLWNGGAGRSQWSC